MTLVLKKNNSRVLFSPSMFLWKSTKIGATQYSVTADRRKGNIATVY